MFNYPVGKGGAPAKKPMMAKAPAAVEEQPEAEGGEDLSDKPAMTHHHPDGTHTTVHESGMEHNHENLEALKSHLDKFLSEEEHEGGGDDWDKE